MSFTTLRLTASGAVATITLARPDKLNALNQAMHADLRAALDRCAADDDVRVVVLTGEGRAFSSGQDLSENLARDADGRYDVGPALTRDYNPLVLRLADYPKVTVAAINGYALGGGCELAMMCDFIIAADTAKFGQPEINLGVTPGIGGTQRMTRAIGKAKAMDLCLTGRMMDAAEAERSGLVSRVVPAAELMDVAMKVAETIAAMSLPVAMMTKESVNRAYETTLAEGIRFERRVFHAMFATADQKEGMAAFIEKRQPNFQDK